MNINDINADVVQSEVSSIDASTTQVVSPERIKAVQPQKDVQKTDQAVQDQALSAKEIENITEDLNNYMTDLQTNLRFSMYEKLDHQVVVQIKNKETDELIKQIPSEELLKLRVKMEELSGLLFDQTI